MDRNDDGPTNKDDGQADITSADDGDPTGRSRDCNSSNEGTKAERTASDPPDPRLVSRVLVAWIELTVVGITGGLLGATVGGPPGFIIYLATTLFTVGIIFYNVNELVEKRVRTAITTEHDET